MAAPPRPYTPEWFEIMEDRNPEQADTARLAAKHTGTEQCCMVCGDTRNVMDFMTDETVAVRICGDCKVIQVGDVRHHVFPAGLISAARTPPRPIESFS